MSKKANKVIKNKVVNDSFCKLEVLALNVCGLVSKLRNPDFREFISLYGIICLTETKLDNYDEVELDGYKLLPPVNRQNCKARSGGICVFVRDFFCKYVHVNDPFTNSSHCVFGLRLMKDCYCKKPYLEWFTYHLIIVYIAILICLMKIHYLIMIYRLV